MTLKIKKINKKKKIQIKKKDTKHKNGKEKKIVWRLFRSQKLLKAKSANKSF
jgi:hypothetical protein